jgi:hypothetical protein
MSKAEPWGNLRTASIMVIGHDPRLKDSMAEAEHAFFFDYLEHERPTYGPDGAKYDLAFGVWKYVEALAGRSTELDELFVTNLCNRLVAPPQTRGVVLIPDDLAQEGVCDLEAALGEGHFRLIIAMAMQSFYHLGRLRFIHDRHDLVNWYVEKARPKPSMARKGVYAPVATGPFLRVCGVRFHHGTTPTVPVVHISALPLKGNSLPYVEPMKAAQREIRAILGVESEAGTSWLLKPRRAR